MGEILGSVLKKLGIKSVINAWGTVTFLGGSTLDHTTVEAYSELSKVFVDMIKYTEAANEYVSKLLGVESAMIVPGAAAGVVIAVASLISDGDPIKASQLPFTQSLKNEILILKEHENPYKYLAQIPGAIIKEIGNENGITENDLKSAINGNTAGILFFDFSPINTGLSLREISELAHELKIPVIVDAAAELPPKINFTKYFTEGADLTIFSGGKDIAGPNNTGIIIGSSQFIKRCKSIGPLIYKEVGGVIRTFIGRPMKMTKEDIAAFVVALENYLNTDQYERLKNLQFRLNTMASKLKEQNVKLKIRIIKEEPGDTIRPLIIPKLAIDASSTGLNAQNIVEQLKNYETPIYCYSIKNEIIINPQCLRPDEDNVIIEALSDILK